MCFEKANFRKLAMFDVGIFLFYFRKVFCIHPSFRIIGLAEPPVINSSQNQWLGSELLTLFLYHHVEPLTKEEEAEIVFNMVYCYSGCVLFSSSFNFAIK